MVHGEDSKKRGNSFSSADEKIKKSLKSEEAAVDSHEERGGKKTVVYKDVNRPITRSRKSSPTSGNHSKIDKSHSINEDANQSKLKKSTSAFKEQPEIIKSSTAKDAKHSELKRASSAKNVDQFKMKRSHSEVEYQSELKKSKVNSKSKKSLRLSEDSNRGESKKSNSKLKTANRSKLKKSLSAFNDQLEIKKSSSQLKVKTESKGRVVEEEPESKKSPILDEERSKIEESARLASDKNSFESKQSSQTNDDSGINISPADLKDENHFKVQSTSIVEDESKKSPPSNRVIEKESKMSPSLAKKQPEITKSAQMVEDWNPSKSFQTKYDNSEMNKSLADVKDENHSEVKSTSIVKEESEKSSPSNRAIEKEPKISPSLAKELPEITKCAQMVEDENLLRSKQSSQTNDDSEMKKSPIDVKVENQSKVKSTSIVDYDTRSESESSSSETSCCSSCSCSSRSHDSSEEVKSSKSHHLNAPENDHKSTEEAVSKSPGNKIMLPTGISFKKINRENTWSTKPNTKTDDDRAIEAFEEMKINADILRGLHSIGIVKPTELQKRLLPRLINTRAEEIFVRSLPFSGKKTAVLISLMQRINTTINSPQAIFLTCTNELTYEMAEKSKQISKYTKIAVRGLMRDKEHRRVDQNLIIGPVGTILYLIRNKVLDVKMLRCLYLDEADILFNSEANERRIYQLINHLQGPSQLIIQSSSTNDELMKKVCGQFLRKPIIFDCLEQSNYFRNIVQFHVICGTMREKFQALLNVIRDNVFGKVLIYASGLPACTSIMNIIRERTEYRFVMLTSDLTIDERLDSIRKFINHQDSNKMLMIVNSPHILTGIDIGCDSCLIINFDLYMITDTGNWYEYFNKIRPCLRHDRPGFVVNLSLFDQIDCAEKLEEYYNLQFIRLDALGDLVRRYSSNEHDSN